MKLTSTSFVDGGPIDSDYAFGKIDAKSHVTLSANRNPQLAWSDAPADARSFALICHDIDVPGKPDDVNQEGRTIPADLPRVDFHHWILLDIPSTVHAIGAGDFSKDVTPRGKAGPMVAHSPIPGVVQGLNGYTEWFSGDHDMSGDYYGYDGPCPPWNDSIVHRYVFTVFALSVDRLEVHGRLTGDAVKAALNGKVLAEASMTGWYSLNPQLAHSV